MSDDYLKYDGRVPEPPYTTADERRIDELLDEIETLQQDNARLRAALVATKYEIIAAIDAALEDLR